MPNHTHPALFSREVQRGSMDSPGVHHSPDIGLASKWPISHI